MPRWVTESLSASESLSEAIFFFFFFFLIRLRGREWTVLGNFWLESRNVSTRLRWKLWTHYSILETEVVCPNLTQLDLVRFIQALHQNHSMDTLRKNNKHRKQLKIVIQQIAGWDRSQQVLVREDGDVKDQKMLTLRPIFLCQNLSDGGRKDSIVNDRNISINTGVYHSVNYPRS